MKVPKGVFREKLFSDFEIKNPTPEVLADTARTFRDGDHYGALRRFVAGCVTEARADDEAVTDPGKIAELVKWLPFKSSEFLSIQILLKYNSGDDGIEGVYDCPRCGNKIISELVEGEKDTRDFISALPCIYDAEHRVGFTYELNDPLEIKDGSGAVLKTVKTLEMLFPTIQHCANASQKVGFSDPIRLQFAVYAECLVKVNGEEMTAKDRAMWGMYIFNKMPNARDVLKIGEVVNGYGIDPRVDKVCLSCGKEFKVAVNTYNFFGSALKL